MSSMNSSSDETSKKGKDSTVRHYNPHILYVESGIANPDQLVSAIKQAISETSKKLNRPIDTKFKVNLVMDRTGKKYGYGYIWFTNPEVCYMLTGKNPDGSERFEYQDDPNWIPPAEPKPVFFVNFEIPYSGRSWADIAEEEEEIEKAYTCPKIKVPLPPLMTLPEYEYTPEQKSDPSVVGSKGRFIVSPAYVGELDSKYCPNILCGRNIPSWVSEIDLKDIFRPYASNPTSQVRRKVNGVNILDTYPFVMINDKRVAFITFDPKTHDAEFALLMCRKVDFEKNDEKYIVVFNHSYRSSS